MAGFPASLRSLGPLCEAALGGLPLPGGPECGGPGGAARVLLLGLELGTPDNLGPLESGTGELWAPETGTPGSPGPFVIARVELALLAMSAVRGLCAGLHGSPRGPGDPDSNWDVRPQRHGVRCTDPGSPARVEDSPGPALQEGYRSVLRELLGTTGTLGSLLDALLCSPEGLLSHGAVQVATALCLLLERAEVPSFETGAWVSEWVSACMSRLTGALSRTQLAALGQAEAAWALSDLVSALAREEASSGRTSEGLAHVLRFLDPVWPTLMDEVFTHAPQIPSPPQPPLLLLALLELQDALVRSGSPGAAGRFPFSCDGARCLLSFLARPAAPYPAVRRLAGHLKRWLVRSARRRADTSCNAHPTGAHPTGAHQCADAEGVVCLAWTLVHAVHTGWLQSIHIHRAAYHLGGQASSSPPWEESATSQLHREEQLCMGSCHISSDRSSGVPSSYFDWPAIDLVTLRGVVLSVLVAAVVCAANLDSVGVRTCVEAAARFALGFLDGPVGPRTDSQLTSHRCLWLVTLFGDQDDDLVEAAMSLLLLRPHLDPDDDEDDGGGAAIPWSERVGVGATCAFVSIVRHACFSPVVLLDLLISSETRFLQLLVLVLRHVRATPHALAQACLTADLHGHTGPAGTASPPAGIHRGQGDQRKPPPPRGEERSPERRSQRRHQNSVCKQGAVAEELGKKKQHRLVDYESSEDDADGGGDRRDERERGTHWASGPESRHLCLRDENGARVNEDNDESDDESDDDHLSDSDVDDGDDSDNDDNESDAAEGVQDDDAVADLDEVDDDVSGSMVAPVPTLLSVLRCLSRLQLCVQRLCRRHLFPYDARPLLRLLSQAQASCAGLCSSSRPSSSPLPVNTSSPPTDSHRDL
ncbi:protein Lines homolog 1 isoform X1 [Petromyzon marinus]|uniref:protein Lines homolog 1 isoform X1 n=1 Tax=Petromyzon marinus TaxID=7757 RepID=UPI003F6E63E9